MRIIEKPDLCEDNLLYWLEKIELIQEIKGKLNKEQKKELEEAKRKYNEMSKFKAF